jgi:hypothetical protein
MPEPRFSFQQTQADFAAHIRHPQQHPAPAHIEERRLEIYRNLFYNNIESFLASGFPILKSLLNKDKWAAMVRDFMHRHQSHSPYFLQISEEFLAYLQNEYKPGPNDPRFMLELAHYEWVELALDVSSAEIPTQIQQQGNVLDDHPISSPTAWRFIYQYPVHLIGHEFQPREPGPEVTALIIYRNTELQIGFMESNPITLRLLDILETEQISGRAAIVKLAAEIEHPEPEKLLEFGAELLQVLKAQEIICGFRSV